MQTNVRLYPSEQNFQKTNDDVVGLSWAIAYLNSLNNQIPTEERASAIVSGWKGVCVNYTHTLTEQQVLKMKLDRVKEVVANAPREGLTAEDIAKLMAILQ